GDLSVVASTENADLLRHGSGLLVSVMTFTRCVNGVVMAVPPRTASVRVPYMRNVHRPSVSTPGCNSARSPRVRVAPRSLPDRDFLVRAIPQGFTRVRQAPRWGSSRASDPCERTDEVGAHARHFPWGTQPI